MTLLAFLPILALNAAPESNLKLTIDTNNPNVILMRIASQGVVSTGYGVASVTQLEKVCAVPCNEQIENLKSDFFFSGDGVPTSDTFSFMGRSGDLTMHVTTGSPGLRFLGASLSFLGILGTVTGGTLWLVGAMSSSSSSSSLGSIGMLTTLGSVAALGVGIPLIAYNGTDFEFLPQGRPATK